MCVVDKVQVKAEQCVVCGNKQQVVVSGLGKKQPVEGVVVVECWEAGDPFSSCRDKGQFFVTELLEALGDVFGQVFLFLDRFFESHFRYRQWRKKWVRCSDEVLCCLTEDVLTIHMGNKHVCVEKYSSGH